MKWRRINRKKLPKTGRIVAGSWRMRSGKYQWSMCTPSDNGWPKYVDDDRTHWLRLPDAPNLPPPPVPPKG